MLRRVDGLVQSKEAEASASAAAALSKPKSKSKPSAESPEKPSAAKPPARAATKPPAALALPDAAGTAAEGHDLPDVVNSTTHKKAYMKMASSLNYFYGDVKGPTPIC